MYSAITKLSNFWLINANDWLKQRKVFQEAARECSFFAGPLYQASYYEGIGWASHPQSYVLWRKWKDPCILKEIITLSFHGNPTVWESSRGASSWVRLQAKPSTACSAWPVRPSLQINRLYCNKQRQRGEKTFSKVFSVKDSKCV